MPLYQDVSILSGILWVRAMVGTKVIHVMAWSGASQTVPRNTCLPCVTAAIGKFGSPHFIFHLSSAPVMAVYSLNWTARHLEYLHNAGQ